MIRKYLDIGNRKISYLDNEKSGQPLICIHGHFGCASMFSFMNNVHNGRLILIDQRGHGLSDHFDTYKTTDYVNDLKMIIDYLNIKNPIILGHSLGGVNAYHYAFSSNNVKSLIIEDIGTEVNCSNEFILNLPREFNSLYEVDESFKKLKMTFEPYFIESIRYDGLKWKFLFDYGGMVESQKEMNGNHWECWKKIDCPILLLHGSKSWACNTKNIKEMAEKKTNVVLKIYEAVGHTLHDEERSRFISDVKMFLNA